MNTGTWLQLSRAMPRRETRDRSRGSVVIGIGSRRHPRDTNCDPRVLSLTSSKTWPLPSSETHTGLQNNKTIKIYLLDARTRFVTPQWRSTLNTGTWFQLSRAMPRRETRDRSLGIVVLSLALGQDVTRETQIVTRECCH